MRNSCVRALRALQLLALVMVAGQAWAQQGGQNGRYTESLLAPLDPNRFFQMADETDAFYASASQELEEIGNALGRYYESLEEEHGENRVHHGTVAVGAAAVAGTIVWVAGTHVEAARNYYAKQIDEKIKKQRKRLEPYAARADIEKRLVMLEENLKTLPIEIRQIEEILAQPGGIKAKKDRLWQEIFKLQAEAKAHTDNPAELEKLKEQMAQVQKRIKTETNFSEDQLAKMRESLEWNRKEHSVVSEELGALQGTLESDMKEKVAAEIKELEAEKAQIDGKLRSIKKGKLHRWLRISATTMAMWSGSEVILASTDQSWSGLGNSAIRVIQKAVLPPETALHEWISTSELGRSPTSKTTAEACQQVMAAIGRKR